MNELDLYKFCEREEVGWIEDELYVWVDLYALEEFVEMVGSEYLSGGGLDINLQYDCVVIELNDICKYFGIDPERILEKENQGELHVRKRIGIRN